MVSICNDEVSGILNLIVALVPIRQAGSKVLCWKSVYPGAHSHSPTVKNVSGLIFKRCSDKQLCFRTGGGALRAQGIRLAFG